MKRKIIYIMMLMSLIWAAFVFGETETESEDIELAGMVVDETRTKVGMDFYELFFNEWEDRKTGFFSKLNYDISISEKPLPRQGSQISVTVIILFQEHLVYQSFVRPGYEDLIEATSYAANNTRSFLENYEQMQEQLYGDDMAGSGVF